LSTQRGLISIMYQEFYNNNHIWRDYLTILNYLVILNLFLFIYRKKQKIVSFLVLELLDIRQDK